MGIKWWIDLKRLLSTIVVEWDLSMFLDMNLLLCDALEEMSTLANDGGQSCYLHWIMIEVHQIDSIWKHNLIAESQMMVTFLWTRIRPFSVGIRSNMVQSNQLGGRTLFWADSLWFPCRMGFEPKRRIESTPSCQSKVIWCDQMACAHLALIPTTNKVALEVAIAPHGSIKKLPWISTLADESKKLQESFLRV